MWVDCRTEYRDESTVVLIILENILAVDAPQHDMVDSRGAFLAIFLGIVEF